MNERDKYKSKEFIAKMYDLKPNCYYNIRLPEKLRIAFESMAEIENVERSAFVRFVFAKVCSDSDFRSELINEYLDLRKQKYKDKAS